MAITRIAHTGIGSASPTTTTAIDTTGASLLVVNVGFGNTGLVLTDSKGNTWIGLAEKSGAGVRERLFYAWNPIVGTGHTFTATSSGDAPSLEVAAYGGVRTSSNPYTATQGASDLAGVTQTGVGTGTITPATAINLIVVGTAMHLGITGYSSQNGFATSDQINFLAGNNYGSALSDIIQTAATAIPNSTVVASWTNAVNIGVTSAVFEGATGGSPATATTLTGPGSGTVGAASSNFMVGANGSITGTVRITPNDGGAGGTFSPTFIDINTASPTGTFTYTAASAGSKTISTTNNGGLTNPTAITYTAASAGSPVMGAASFVSATSTTINVSSTAATGGTAPLTYQWHRSTTANFTPGSGTVLAGATSLTLADSASLAADTPYYYICRVTDAAAATSDSNQVAGVLKAATLKLGFIGDSITFGFGLSAGQDPVTQIIPILRKTYKSRDVTANNSAVSGSKTSQWVSGQTNLTTAKTAFAAAGVTHVHIMLGANDAAAGNLVSAATYKANLQNTITDLNGAGYKVILSYPTYIPAGANSNATVAASVALAQSYQAQIDSLIDGVNVLRGDKLSFNYFMDNLTEYQSDMTHPTAAGAISLATMWARAIDRSLLDPSGTTPPSGPTRTITVRVADYYDTPLPNLTGLKWSVHVEKTPDLWALPIAQGAGATTDSNAMLTVTFATALTAGTVVCFTFSNGDGNLATIQSTNSNLVALT